jgi:hypothetical protein
MRSTTIRPSSRRAILALLAAGAIAATAVPLAVTGGGIEPVKVTAIHYISAADFSDDRRLAGFAEDVFLGRVTAPGTTVQREPVLETHFQVDVLDSIKGSAGGTVLVAQQGGYVPGANELRVLEGDQLLEAGKTYLFATRTDTDGRRIVVPRFGDVGVRDTAHHGELKQRFSEASRTAIPFHPGG